MTDKLPPDVDPATMSEVLATLAALRETPPERITVELLEARTKLTILRDAAGRFLAAYDDVDQSVGPGSSALPPRDTMARYAAAFLALRRAFAFTRES